MAMPRRAGRVDTGRMRRLGTVIVVIRSWQETR
jgi:hypothetical protein